MPSLLGRFDSGSIRTCIVRNRTRSETRGGAIPGKAGNRERSDLEGAARIAADFFRSGHTAGRAPIRTGGLYRVLCIKSKSKVDFAYASKEAYYLSMVQFFPPLRRPAEAAGVDDGSLYVPYAVVAPPSGSLALTCFAICQFDSLN
jgi:hypothetical protein